MNRCAVLHQFGADAGAGDKVVHWSDAGADQPPPYHVNVACCTAKFVRSEERTGSEYSRVSSGPPLAPP